MMTRLSAREYESLKVALADIHSPVYLFGGRTNPARRGGDIDVLVISDELSSRQLSAKLGIQRTFTAMTDQKLDIVILPTQRTQQQERFFTSVSKIPRGSIQQQYEKK